MFKIKNSKVIINFSSLANFLLLAFLVFSYVGFGQVLLGSVSENLDEEAVSGNIFRQLSFLFFWGLSLVCFLKLGGIDKAKYFLGFSMILAWCLISTTWSVEPGISFRRFVLLFLTSSTLFMLICVNEREKLLKDISFLYAVLIGVSFIAVVVFPGAVHQESALFDTGLAGNWRGVFVHKNDAGAAIACAILLFSYQYLKTKNLYWIVFSIFALLFLYFTKSKTSLGLVFPSVFFGILMMRLSDSLVFSKVLKVIVVLLISAFLFFSNDFILFFASLIEDPELFTGRGTIWSLVFPAFIDNWLLGLGYGGVWRVGDAMVLPNYAFGWVDWVFDLSEGHSGYLDTLASIGVIGFVIFSLVLIILPLMDSKRINELGYHFPFLFYSIYFFFLLHNLLETNFLLADKGRWLLFLGIYFIYRIGSDAKYVKGR